MVIEHPLPYDALFFDADWTLRKCTVPNQPCPNTSDQWELMPNVKNILSFYDWSQTGFSVISNQGGIGLGFLSDSTAYQLICDLIITSIGRFPPIGSIFICPHPPNDNCPCRKPKPQMLLKAEMFWHNKGILHAPRTCVYIGDMESDEQAANAAEIDFIYAKDFFGWENATPNTAETTT
jgi:D-glycero-D-manno-heptose 1,7-bisphosphate phosphatase